MVGLVLDLVSKYLAFEHVADVPVVVSREQVLAITDAPIPLPASGGLGRLIPPHAPVVVVPGVLNFTLVLNPGAVFGMGAGKRYYFLAFTAAAVTFALWVFARWTRDRDRFAHVSIGLVISGGLGNLYDRIVYACVRDFIHPLPGVHFPFGWRVWGGSGEVWPWVSNVADALLLVGIGGLAIHLWLADRRAAQSAKAATGQASPVRPDARAS